MNTRLLLGLLTTVLLSSSNLWADNRPNPRLVVFHTADFRGEQLFIRGDWSAPNRYDYWNDAINSLIVPRGYEAILYEHSRFRGEYLVVRGEWSSRQDRYWFNRISSIQLRPIGRHAYDPLPPRPLPTHTCGPSCGRGDCGFLPAPEITVFEHHSFRGAALTIAGEWSVAYTDDFWNDRISSIYVPRGYAVILYEHAYFGGRSVLIEGSWNTAHRCDYWNDRISSLRVVRR
ncbi:MAG: beta/gamma crystallin-related protein [Bacteroidota bacterium]